VAENESFQLPYDPKWELEPCTSLQLGQVLGIGAYGKIVVAEVRSAACGAETVAVKMLKQSFKPAELKNLICELEILKVLDHHENIVNLIGCYTTKSPPLLFMDYAELGNLQTYLKSETNVQELTYGRQISIALQIAKGMEFLAKNKVKLNVFFLRILWLYPYFLFTVCPPELGLSKYSAHQ
jgi:serine/threonine protein kinase